MKKKSVKFLYLLPFLALLLHAQSYPVISYHALIGGVSEGKYLTKKESFSKFKGTTSAGIYMLYGKKGRKKETYTLEKIVLKKDPESGLYAYVTTGKGPSSDDMALPKQLLDKVYAPVLHQERHEVFSRYEKELKSVLCAHGIEETPVTIRESYRVDVDRDGQEEVLLIMSESKNLPIETGTFQSGRHADFGDYAALVLLRQSDEGYVATLITGDFFTHKIEKISEHDLPKYDIKTVVDINGDGSVEVLLYKQFWSEGVEVGVYDISGLQAEKVF